MSVSGAIAIVPYENVIILPNTSGIPAAISNDAGNNLCNQILYEGLQYSMHHAGQMRCGFVHIPALPQQVIERWPDYPFMPLDMIRAAMAIILFELVRGTSDA